jgi:putative sterol carrier protein
LDKKFFIKGLLIIPKRGDCFLATVKECFEAMINSFDPEKAKGYNRIVQYNVKTNKGIVGANYYIVVKDQKATLNEGEHPNPNHTATMDADNWVKFASGKLSPIIAALTGKIKTTMSRSEGQLWGACFPLKKKRGWF